MDNYWRWLKKKFIADGIQIASITHKFKFEATDSKKYATDCFIQDDITELVKAIPSKRNTDFFEWFIQLTLFDEQS